MTHDRSMTRHHLYRLALPATNTTVCQIIHDSHMLFHDTRTSLRAESHGPWKSGDSSLSPSPVCDSSMYVLLVSHTAHTPP
eukprot:SAG25_NODE_7598_length_471_cov_0.655914_1_plen_80_part_10